MLPIRDSCAIVPTGQVAKSRLCALAQKAGGHVLLEGAPPDFKKDHDVFGPARAEWRLMHKLKDALDPHNLFAPGRLPGRR